MLRKNKAPGEVCDFDVALSVVGGAEEVFGLDVAVHNVELRRRGDAYAQVSADTEIEHADTPS